MNVKKPKRRFKQNRNLDMKHSFSDFWNQERFFVYSFPGALSIENIHNLCSLHYVQGFHEDTACLGKSMLSGVQGYTGQFLMSKSNLTTDKELMNTNGAFLAAVCP